MCVPRHGETWTGWSSRPHYRHRRRQCWRCAADRGQHGDGVSRSLRSHGATDKTDQIGDTDQTGATDKSDADQTESAWSDLVRSGPWPIWSDCPPADILHTLAGLAIARAPRYASAFRTVIHDGQRALAENQAALRLERRSDAPGSRRLPGRCLSGRRRAAAGGRIAGRVVSSVWHVSRRPREDRRPRTAWRSRGQPHRAVRGGPTDRRGRNGRCLSRTRHATEPDVSRSKCGPTGSPNAPT